MEVDPGDAATMRAVLGEHGAQDQVRPGRRLAAEEEPVGAIALPAGDRRLHRALAHLLPQRLQRGFVRRRRRPVGRHEQRVHAQVGLVARDRQREVAEVAVEVDVRFVRAREVREAVRIDRMHVHDRDARLRDRRGPGVVLEQRDLAARAAEALGAVHRRGQHEQRARGLRSGDRDVHRERLAVRAARARVHVRLDREVARTRRREEARARLGVAGGERGGGIAHGSIPPTLAALAAPRGASASGRPVGAHRVPATGIARSTSEAR